jgi:hypothetical protein
MHLLSYLCITTKHYSCESLLTALRRHTDDRSYDTLFPLTPPPPRPLLVLHPNKMSTCKGACEEVIGIVCVVEATHPRSHAVPTVSRCRKPAAAVRFSCQHYARDSGLMRCDNQTKRAYIQTHLAYVQ